MANGTYVYCLIASARRPALNGIPRGLPRTGPVRLLDVDRGLTIAVADAPLSRYGERAIERGLSDLDWVSRAAVAHEAVIESFIDATAVLPMKLFTIFTSDARALDHVRADEARIRALVKRVANQHEWSVRIVLDRSAVDQGRRTGDQGRRTGDQGRRAGDQGRRTGDQGRRTGDQGPMAGLSYLARKKARRDAATELRERARETVAEVYDRLAARARLARRRSATELPMADGPLLLDGAFLVPRSRTAAFRAFAAREARALARRGYGLTLTGPWPPYSFVQD